MSFSAEELRVQYRDKLRQAQLFGLTTPTGEAFLRDAEALKIDLEIEEKVQAVKGNK